MQNRKSNTRLEKIHDDIHEIITKYCIDNKIDDSRFLVPPMVCHLAFLVSLYYYNEEEHDLVDMVNYLDFHNEIFKLITIKMYKKLINEQTELDEKTD